MYRSQSPHASRVYEYGYWTTSGILKLCEFLRLAWFRCIYLKNVSGVKTGPGGLCFHNARMHWKLWWELELELAAESRRNWPNSQFPECTCSITHNVHISVLPGGGQWVWAQPMKDDVTMYHRLSLAEPIPRMRNDCHWKSFSTKTDADMLWFFLY